MAGKVSAGILLFRRVAGILEVLLAHPGGPFTVKKDIGIWSIPKGEAANDESLLERAKIEFAEEIGTLPSGEFIELGSIKQKGGKVVHAWALEGDFTGPHSSNTFELEWPPRSGKLQNFPEVDRAEFFNLESALLKINGAQRDFLERLVAELKREP